MGFKITATGTQRPHPAGGARRCSPGEVGDNPVDAHAIQPFYTGLLARTCGLSVTLAPEGEAIVVTRAVTRARRPAAPPDRRQLIANPAELARP